MELTAAWVNSWSYNQHLFRTNYPERIVTIKGDFDPNALEAAKRRIFSEAGPASWERIILMPMDQDMDIVSTPLRDTPRDMLYGDLLNSVCSLKAAALGVPKDILSLDLGEKGSASISIRGEAQAEIHKAHAEEALVTQLNGIAGWFTRTIVHSFYPDLLMIWDGLKPEEERERVEVTVQKVGSYMTIDEARAVENLDPLPNGLGQYPLPVVERILQNEADLIEAQAEMDAMGTSAEGRIKLPNDGSAKKPASGPAKPSQGSNKPTGSPTPRKGPDEPGEARRTRDRAKQTARSILEQRMAERSKGNKADPGRARADHERRRPH